MNILPADELLNLSIFKCKICRNRLQRPIIIVRNYGNICGACNERSCFISTTENIELEELLSKLHVSCNYKERGCTYDGTYKDTCAHEKRCVFRDKICPFAYVGQCENIVTNFHDLAVHISNRHSENVLQVGNNGSAVISNPTKANPDIFYLLSLHNKDFLLRAWINKKNQYIFYAFYYFKNNIASRNAKFSFNMRCNNTIFTITSVNVDIQHESTILSTYDTANAVMIPLTTLMYLNCLKTVEVLISVKEDLLNPASAEIEEFQEQFAKIKCPICSRIADSIQFCRNCDYKQCSSCDTPIHHCPKTLGRQNMGYRHNIGYACNFETINFDAWKLIYKLPCENPGCNQIVTVNKHNKHKDICPFKKLQCPARDEKKCTWQGLIEEMATHIKSLHTTHLAQNAYNFGVPEIFFFLKGDDIFKQTYKLASNGDFSLATTKVTTPVWDESYRWELRIKRKDVPMMMVVTDVCTERGCKKTINVENYLEDGKLTFYVDIKRASMSSEYMHNMSQK